MMERLYFRHLFPALCGLLIFVAGPALSPAGDLVLYNGSAQTISCTVDGYPNQPFNPLPDQKLRIPPNPARNPQLIDWVSCGNLKTRRMNILPASPDALLLFNGQQTRTLNVLLYPFIPSNPNNNFFTLKAVAIGIYQMDHPQVLLNVVMDQNVEMYKFPAVQALFGATGYDIVELDTSFLNFVVSNNLITPVNITGGDAPWPVALGAVTLNSQVYGVPSWLCTDFAFSFDSGIQKQSANLTAFLQYLSSMPAKLPRLVGDYDGSWNIPTMYLNAYVQTYGYSQMKNAFQMPPDATVIQNLASLTSTCSISSTNNCVNNTYHNLPDGGVDQVFATGGASNDMGFSEQSFYILLAESGNQPVYAVPVPWGATPQPLLFTDAFVTNRATCSTQPCAGDGQYFTSMMTSAAMKSVIAFSADLPYPSPPRHLLVATKPFWSTPSVQNDPLYQQFSSVLKSPQPFPNWFTQQNQTAMYTQVCSALQQQVPSYYCSSSAPAPQPSSSSARRSPLH